MAGKDDLVSASGRPLFPEPKLVVIKCPRNVPISRQTLTGIVNLLKCTVVTIPMSAEFMMGEVAEQELQSTHQAIHAVFRLVENEFNEKEIATLYKAMEFLCKQTSPNPDSQEVKLAKKLKKLTQPKTPPH